MLISFYIDERSIFKRGKYACSEAPDAAIQNTVAIKVSRIFPFRYALPQHVFPGKCRICFKNVYVAGNGSGVSLAF